MLESIRSDAFTYKKLSEEEQKQRGILGRLVGVIADFKNPTRNGRHYSEKLWETVFNDPIMKEKIENRLCFGEFGHPAERLETDPEKIAICLTEIPKKGNDGKLYGCFDILDTPCGRILKTVCDYGANIGVSSRGEGDTELDDYGNEQVSEDNYQCECFDAVLIPAVKEARPKYVTESLQRKSLTESLKTLVEKAEEKDKKVMEETIKELNLDNSSAEKQELENIDVDTNKEAAGNTESKLVNDLQEALQLNTKSQKQIMELQEKLSVGNAKEAKLNEKLSAYRKLTESLSKSLSKQDKTSEDEVKKLKESLRTKDAEIQQKDIQLEKLTRNLNRQRKINEGLQNTFNTTREEVDDKQSEIVQLQERYERKLSIEESKQKKLEEAVEDLRKDIQLKEKQNIRKINESQQLVEKYKNTARKAVSKYIELQANQIGVKPEEIKNKLGESYSFADIDKICEDLRTYKINVNRLPFQLNEAVSPRINYKKSRKETILPQNDDDYVDDSLTKYFN